MARVNYEENQHKQVAENVTNSTMLFFKEGLNAHSAGEVNTATIDSWATEFLGVWERYVGHLAPMVKDPAFRGENEYRIVHELQAHEIGQLLFKQKEPLLSRHLPLIFPPPNYATQSRLLPIAEVMVGPSRHKEISRVSVDTLLRQKGYQVPVTVSKIPFQLT